MKYKYTVIILTCALAFFFFGSQAHAADSKIYFDAPATVAKNSDIAVNLFIDTTEPINAFDIEIAFPKDKLKFINSANAGSIIDVWQPKPTLLPNGNIHLAGGILTSYVGTKGLLVKLSFRAMAEGTVKITFTKSNVYIADGKGSVLPLTPISSNIAITQAVDVPTPAAGGQTVVVNNPIPLVEDNTKPEILFEETLSPVDHSRLLVFRVTDKESGIVKTEMRYKKWFSYGEWQDAENPTVYPDGAWKVELRATNGANLSAIKDLTSDGTLVKKISIGVLLLLLLAALVFRIISVYNIIK